MQYCHVYARDNNGTNASTSRKNLVKIGPASLVENRLENRNRAATRPQFDDRPSFCTLVFQNGLEYRNSNFRVLSDNHFCKLCRRFVRFGTVTPEFQT